MMTWYPPEGMQGFSKASFEKLKPSSSLAPLTATLPVVLPGGGRPNAGYRRSFGFEDFGWDVWALQVALNSHQKTFPITEDGLFGKQTRECVLREQRNHHQDVDGVIGPLTQAAICKTEAKLAEVNESLPLGLLYGISLGESGWQFAAVSGPNWNNSYDGGATQENLTDSQIDEVRWWRQAFDLRWGFADTGHKLRVQFDRYIGDPGAQTAKSAWYAAITYHNWPAAADKMAAGHFDFWQYYAVDANGVGRYYGVDDPAYWVKAASSGRLSTARQWRDDYIRGKIGFVKNWDVA